MLFSVGFNTLKFSNKNTNKNPSILLINSTHSNVLHRPISIEVVKLLPVMEQIWKMPKRHGRVLCARACSRITGCSRGLSSH